MILSALQEAEIDPGRRGESLSIEEFAVLSDALISIIFINTLNFTKRILALCVYSYGVNGCYYE